MAREESEFVWQSNFSSILNKNDSPQCQLNLTAIVSYPRNVSTVTVLHQLVYSFDKGKPTSATNQFRTWLYVIIVVPVVGVTAVSVAITIAIMRPKPSRIGRPLRQSRSCCASVTSSTEELVHHENDTASDNSEPISEATSYHADSDGEIAEIYEQEEENRREQGRLPASPESFLATINGSLEGSPGRTFLENTQETGNSQLNPNFANLGNIELHRIDKPQREKTVVYMSFWDSVDSIDRDWVRQHLMPRLRCEEGIEIIDHEIDFTVGEHVYKNIHYWMRQSDKAIFVLSEEFMKKEWCEYEKTQAIQRGIELMSTSFIIPVIYRPCRQLPREMDFKTHISADDPNFWSRLIQAIKT
eukprot:m.199480 g.199480  ORF g.199480 m.199480 type:complete len:358 (+) comp39572_c0_seq2:1180-2253(+)